MKKGWILMFLIGVVLGLPGVASADLTVIGTATYQGNDYNLIYEDDSIYGGLVWLDYSRIDAWHWANDWAAGLNGSGVLTFHLNPGVNVSWGGAWRLPLVDESKANLSGGYGYEGPDQNGYHDYLWGHNMINSELGHLYYMSLGNKGYRLTDGTYPPDIGLLNTGDFINLQPTRYWSGNEISLYPGHAWFFNFEDPDSQNPDPLNFGWQGATQWSYGDGINFQAAQVLAVRPVEVTVVPIPGSIWLLGSGLIGLLGFRRKPKQ